MFEAIVVALLLVIILLLMLILVRLRGLNTWQDVHMKNVHHYGSTILGWMQKL